MARTMDLLRRLLRHVGRRGAYLLFLTLLDLVIGYSLQQPLPGNLSHEAVYKPFIDLMPLSGWVAAWICVGILTTVAAVWHKAREITFGLAAMLKTGWALGYVVGWREHQPAFIRGYLSAAIFGAFAIITLLVAGWRENMPTRPRNDQA